MLLALVAAVGTAGAEVVWYRDVQPIVQARCQACHTTGGVAPFPLLSLPAASHTTTHSQTTTDASRSTRGSRRTAT